MFITAKHFYYNFTPYILIATQMQSWPHWGFKFVYYGSPRSQNIPRGNTGLLSVPPHAADTVSPGYFHPGLEKTHISQAMHCDWNNAIKLNQAIKTSTLACHIYIISNLADAISEFLNNCSSLKRWSTYGLCWDMISRRSQFTIDIFSTVSLYRTPCEHTS